MKTRLALLLPMLAFAGCTAKNNGSIRMAAICPAPSDASTCTFASCSTAQYIGANTMDIALTTHLWLGVQVDNNMPKNDAKDTFRTNTNDAFVQEYVVEYVGAALPSVSGPVQGSGLVPAEGSSVISILPVNDATTAAINAAGGIPLNAQVEVVAKVRLKGVLADTTSFETGVYEIPITICNNCLGWTVLTCAAATDVPTYCPSAGQLPSSRKCVTP